jgi:hypothetical protein
VTPQLVAAVAGLGLMFAPTVFGYEGPAADVDYTIGPPGDLGGLDLRVSGATGAALGEPRLGTRAGDVVFRNDTPAGRDDRLRRGDRDPGERGAVTRSRRCQAWRRLEGALGVNLTHCLGDRALGEDADPPVPVGR